MKHQAINPYLPGWEYIPDGEPYVFGDRLYVFGSHDQFGGQDFCLGNYMGWSAPVDDLGDWRCEGVIYEKTQDPLYKPGNRMFAPDVQQGADGRYYLYYGFDFVGVIGVAVCDTPAGHYRFYGHVHYPDGTLLGRRAGDQFQYDPGVQVEPDGRVFLYTGFCFDAGMPFFARFLGIQANEQGAMVTQLEPDMVTVKTAPRFLVPCAAAAQGTGFEGHAFFEASSLRHIGDKYYFVYSAQHGDELCYAVSDRPDGGFAFGGVIISNGDLGYQGNQQPMNYTGTNHGSLVQVGDSVYIFYHRQTGGTPFGRQGCAERVTILPDGSIPQVCITSQGLNGEPLAGKGTYNAANACCLLSAQGAAAYIPRVPLDGVHPFFTQAGPDREGDAANYIANLQDGAAFGFRYFRLAEGTRIRAAVRGSFAGTVEVSDSLRGTPAARLTVTPAADWTDTDTVTLDLPAGDTALWLCCRGEGTLEVRDITLL